MLMKIIKNNKTMVDEKLLPYRELTIRLYPEEIIDTKLLQGPEKVQKQLISEFTKYLKDEICTSQI